ncbi:hypothetical protein GGX14DRAFT_393530 [Mycena pura]|uniref:Uncharacterized protein n=1 Tax=Mycena pura TaxID=153505 RepID=A0AAD6VP98_9AGAR|nr:hypothetical protein GGX14DRAFT_393530 [Mycena pura]
MAPMSTQDRDEEEHNSPLNITVALTSTLLPAQFDVSPGDILQVGEPFSPLLPLTGNPAHAGMLGVIACPGRFGITRQTRHIQHQIILSPKKAATFTGGRRGTTRKQAKVRKENAIIFRNMATQHQLPNRSTSFYLVPQSNNPTMLAMPPRASES